MSPKDNKPFLRITKGYNTLHSYLAIKHYVGTQEKTLKSFGNADNPDNWDDALTFLFSALREHYSQLKHDYLVRGCE